MENKLEILENHSKSLGLAAYKMPRRGLAPSKFERSVLLNTNVPQPTLQLCFLPYDTLIREQLPIREFVVKLSRTSNGGSFNVFSTSVEMTQAIDFSDFQLPLSFTTGLAPFPSCPTPDLRNESSVHENFAPNVLHSMQRVFNLGFNIQGKTPLQRPGGQQFEADFSLERPNGEIFLLGEEKPQYEFGKWELLSQEELNAATPEVINNILLRDSRCHVNVRQLPSGGTASEFNFRMGVRQLVAYLYCLNKTRAFGILTSYAQTYFIILERPKNGPTELKVSPLVNYNHAEVLKRMAEFINLAFNYAPEDAPKDAEKKVRISKTPMQTRSKEKQKETRTMRMITRGQGAECQEAEEEMYAMKGLIGSGRSGFVLRLVDSKNQSFAAKVIGELKDKSKLEKAKILSELKNEAAIYRVLNKFDLGVVPKFYFDGYLDEALYTLVLEELDADPLWKCDPSEISIEAIVSALRKIHNVGILHNDINESNILLGRHTESVYFVDFAFSTKGRLKKEFENEIINLRALLNMYVRRC